jgi:hypothetical protein
MQALIEGREKNVTSTVKELSGGEWDQSLMVI